MKKLKKIVRRNVVTEPYATNVTLISLSVATFIFQNEIQFASDTIMNAQIKHDDSHRCCGCNVNWFHEVLHHISGMTGLW